MNKIDSKLEEIQQQRRMGLMTHVVIGYPSLEETKELVNIMEDNGVDFVELQIPFSDPLADGSTITMACEKSLALGTTVKDAFTLAETLAKQVRIPLLFMAYYNTVFHYGTKQFCKDAANVGISGVIVPDMPIDEEKREHFYAHCKKNKLHAIHVISSVATNIRLQKNAEMATGFIYVTARQGITGVKNAIDKELFGFIQKVKTYFSIPIAIGFGISRKEQIKALRGKADIVVIGSALLDLINKNIKSNRKKIIKDFIAALKMLQ
jgi:tryptophan synthase alpha subunit